jgi:hypothetical protein
MWRSIPSLLTSVLASAFAILLFPALARADYLTDWELRAFVSDQTLRGVTVRDRESWHVRIDGNGEFKMQHANRVIARGTWTVSGSRLQFMFSRGGQSCRMLYFNSSQELEWQDCATGAPLSRIISPSFDPGIYAGLNQLKAAQAVEGLRMMQGVVGAMPQHGAPGIITGSLSTLIDFEIARNLSKAGQQAHVRALTRSLETGQPETWQLGRESGTAAPSGDRYTDALGRLCQDQDEEVRVEGRTIRKRGTYCWDNEGNLTKVA